MANADCHHLSQQYKWFVVQSQWMKIMNLFLQQFFAMCICLCAGRTAIPQAQEFLKRWPTPQKACQAKLYDVLDVIEPLGFGRTQAATIMRFSCNFFLCVFAIPIV